MYRQLGEKVSRFPVFTLGAWLVLALSIILTRPATEGIWQEGEFAFLPKDAVSVQAQQMFREAFPPTNGRRFDDDDTVGTSVQRDPLGSNIAVVLFRQNRPEGLSDDDRAFIRDHLVPSLEKIRRSTPAGYQHEPGALYPEISERERVIRGISTPDDKRIGFLLISPDERAALVVLQLQTEFLDRQNGLVVDRIEELLFSSQLLREKPIGLAIALSGSATVGRDILRGEWNSARRTETITKFLVIVLLLLIYRAPILALVPLLTVGISVEFTLALLTHMAERGWIGLFNGLEVYVTVVVYGAGVDYCLFLIARYKEELDAGHSFAQAIIQSIRKVGAALATSAGTSIVGIGMMGFAEFGKFRQAGFAISIGLFVAACFAVTFTPAILLILKNWAFWPDIRQERPQTERGWLPTASLWKALSEQRLLDEGWNWIAKQLRHYPGFIFLGTVLIMFPFAIVGLVKQSDLSYGLLTDLPQDDTSVEGARAIHEHFPAGITGPATVLVKFDHAALKSHFDEEDLTDITVARHLNNDMTAAITSRFAELREDGFEIVDIRTQRYPLGTSEKSQEYLRSLPLIQQAAKRKFEHWTYNSVRGPLAGQVMRFDFVFESDPFERVSIRNLARLEGIIHDAVPSELRDSTEILTLGPTSGIRDLKQTTDGDRIRIDFLVVFAVYIMLVMLLRQPAICAYLILTVVFSYLVALGVTYLAFYYRDPVGFNGIDWKVPIYLFTILIAMGEDYNILLMSRVTEEQRRYGPIEGILVALTRTGSIISSCGIIMAGTFASLMAGTLLGMVQLGFALSFGVLLDTFVVRPILVPAYLIMLNRGTFGKASKFLGAMHPVPPAQATVSQDVDSDGDAAIHESESHSQPVG